MVDNNKGIARLGDEEYIGVGFRRMRRDSEGGYLSFDLDKVSRLKYAMISRGPLQFHE